ncbi:hypothetical protein BZA70DRAFT_204449 [Myxozyma melibiosi]|uniref:Biogenesis of lysosome-related organelles complex 1 subunit CNL1 n=1 Tax=Myxozyma melibiosi TaxID=54550 RepID=A0ABR1F519_9ASCO
MDKPSDDIAPSSRESVEIMSTKFESMIREISDRMNSLIQQTCESSDKHHEQCVSIADEAEWEIERLKLVMEKCSDLDLEFAKIKRIGEIQRIQTTSFIFRKSSLRISDIMSSTIYLKQLHTAAMVFSARRQMAVGK